MKTLWTYKRLYDRIAMWSLWCVLCTMTSCYSVEQSQHIQGFNDTNRLMLAEMRLRNHDIQGARLLYYEVVLEQELSVSDDGAYSSIGEAYAGKAITDLFLLPDSIHVRSLLTNHFGATRSEYNFESLFWAEQGMLYWFSRGTRWDDDGEFQGVRRLIEEHLPWMPERLDSIEQFVEPLDGRVDLMRMDLLSIADAMAQIEFDLGAAMEDPHFSTYYLPGAVFHSDDLGLAFGHSELLALKGLVACVRGVIYFVAAYEHAWSLKKAWGAMWKDVLQDPQHPEHVQEFTSVQEYSYTYLGEQLGKNIAVEDLLVLAKTSFKEALTQWRGALEQGRLEEYDFGSLMWSRVDRSMLDRIWETLYRLHDAFDRPSVIPHTIPETTLDLTVFFEQGGRVLPPQLSWFDYATHKNTNKESTPSTSGAWSLDPDAEQAFFVDGVFSPSFDVRTPSGESYPKLLDGALGSFFEDLWGGTKQNFEDVYY